MKGRELRGLGDVELRQKLDELYKDIMKENAQIATGTTPKNPGKIKVMKKTIARIKMILAEKEIKKKISS